jgi:photosystem II stability/assembly factor-like uncharacterized protein
MCSKWTNPGCMLVLIGLFLMSIPTAADATLVGWWKFDETSGNIAHDSSGYGNHGVLYGGLQLKGGGLEFDGVDDYVDCGDGPSLNITDEVTVMAWIKLTGQAPDRKIAGNQDDITGGYKFGVYSNMLEFEIRTADNVAFLNRSIGGGTILEQDVYHHVVGVYSYQGGYIRTYVDGVLDRELSTTAELGTSTGTFKIGREPFSDSYFWLGLMDDVRVYNRALTQDEIWAIARGEENPFASNPYPADGTIYEDTWMFLSWEPGSHAVSHDVYFGDNFDDVNDASRDSDAFRGNQGLGLESYIVGLAGYPFPDGLVPGTTYYWRIDEVNDLDPDSPWKGTVWSFIVQPKTAYDPVPSDGGMFVGADVTLSWKAGMGSILHHVYFGENWNEVKDGTSETYKGLVGTTTYTPGLLELDKTYYWRIDEFDGIETHQGNVWSFTVEFFEEFPTWNMPDPAVTRLTLEPERANPGEPIIIRASVANVGTAAAGTAELIFLVDDVEIAREVIETLGPSEEIQTRSIWVAESPGCHPVVAQLELGQDTEFDRTFENNHQTATARVSGEEPPTPELEIEMPSDVTYQLVPGESTTIPVTFHNPSFALVRNIPIRFYIDGEQTSEDVIEYLAPGEEQEFQFHWSNVTSGEHMITVEMDLPDEFHDAVFQHVKACDIVAPDITLLCDSNLEDRWVSIGPRMLTNGSTGRIHEIAFHPSDSNIIYASTPKGGIWKTTNGGNSWAPLGDKLDSLGGSAIAVDPKHPQVVYYATGWAQYGGGVGIYKSIDGGAHWHLFAPKAVAAGVNKFVIRYPNAGHVLIYAATDRGVLRYESNDPLAKTSILSEWLQIKTGVILDMAVHPTNNSLVYASVYDGWVQEIFPGLEKKNVRKIDGLFRTYKGETATGESDWTKLTNGLPHMEGTSLRIDICKGDPKILYASVIHPYGIDPIEPMLYLGIFRTKDAGDSWELIRGYGSYDVPGTYNPFIRVHPTNSNLIYFGGVSLFKEYVNSATWKPEVVKGIHADQHGLEFDPHDSSRYYVGNDGGVWCCTVKTTGDASVHRNFELRTIEFYDFDASQTNSNLMIGGTQDNGTILYEGNPDWREIRGGDGYHSLIAPTNNQVMYSQNQFFDSTARSDDGGKTWKGANKGLPEGYLGSAWITSHPNSAYTVLAQGDQVYATSNGGANWTPKGPKGSNVKGSVNRVVVQPTTFDWIAGSTKGQIWYTSYGGSPWSLLFEHPYGAGVVRLTFAPTDYKVLYALFDIGGNKAYTRIWRFVMNPGPPVSWSASNITDNFPTNRTPLVICGDGHRSDVVYVGTEKGVFRWDDNKATYESWRPYNDCLPLAIINDLLVDPSSKELRAATQGRGAWTVITGP